MVTAKQPNAPQKWVSQPSRTHRFFLYDPEGNGFMFFSTAEMRDAEAPRVIGEYCDEGWSEEVSLVCAGEITAVTQQTDVVSKPERAEFSTDEEFEDAMDDWPNHDFDSTCNYELRPVGQE